jgi:hypothetical protein
MLNSTMNGSRPSMFATLRTQPCLFTQFNVSPADRASVTAAICRFPFSRYLYIILTPLFCSPLKYSIPSSFKPGLFKISVILFRRNSHQYFRAAAVAMVTCYELDDRGRGWSSSPGRVKNFLFLVLPIFTLGSTQPPI